MTDAVQYTFRHEPQTAPRAYVQVPPAFAKALTEQWKYVQKDQINPVIDFATANEAALHLSYAKQWGRDQKTETHPEITVRKGTHREGDRVGTLRLIMTPFDPNAPKRGRKAKTEATA